MPRQQRRRNRPRWRRRLRLAASSHRTRRSDLALAVFLALIAGCANSGGFMMLGSYASHMTGYLSQIGDQLALFNFGLALKAIATIVAFALGAASSAAMINWARLHHLPHQYTIPIGVQGGLFLALSVLGFVAGTSPEMKLLGLFILSYIMGLQNATITEISGARIRTTHATGMITDVSIEFGNAVYGRVTGNPKIKADMAKVGIFLPILGSFVAGGVIGAFGFAYYSYFFALPLGVALILLAIARP